MNQESALANMLIQVLLSGAIEMKSIKMIAWRKQGNFPSDS